MIGFLERILEQAKRGDLQSAAVACVYRDDCAPSGGTDTGWCFRPGTRFALGYAIQLLGHRWCKDMDDPATP